jgi:hypothetical protein
MNRYRVEIFAELQAESEDEAVEFLETIYGDVDPDKSRVLTIEIYGGEVIDTPEWVQKAASR